MITSRRMPFVPSHPSSSWVAKGTLSLALSVSPCLRLSIHPPRSSGSNDTDRWENRKGSLSLPPPFRKGRSNPFERKGRKGRSDRSVLRRWVALEPTGNVRATFEVASLRARASTGLPSADRDEGSLVSRKGSKREREIEREVGLVRFERQV